MPADPERSQRETMPAEPRQGEALFPERSQRDELAGLRAENARLRARLARQEAELYRLSQWLRSLNRDLRDIYRSFTWRIGYTVTRSILWLLRKPRTPTAEQHIKRIETSFESWRGEFFRARREQGLLPYMAWHPQAEYTAWWQAYYPPADARALLAQAQAWQVRPRFSLCLNQAMAGSEGLNALLASLQGQVWPQWELLVACQEKAPLLEAMAAAERRVRLIPLAPEISWADLANRLLAEAGGEFVAWIGPHDRLADSALYRLAERLNQHPEAMILYADEDKLDASGNRCDPYFKPDWDPDLFQARDYLGQFTVCQREAVLQAGGLTGDFPGAEHYDLRLRLLEHAGFSSAPGAPQPPIEHLSEILYHRRVPEDDADHGFACPQQARRALEAHLRRRGVAAEVLENLGGHLQVRYPLPDPAPLVSVIIPTRDRLALLRDTVQGVLQQTDYPALELIILDNGSQEAETLAYLRELEQTPQVTIRRVPGPFNYSRLNNQGAALARGSVLALLNNDLQIIDPGWLKELVGQAMRQEVGAVGAKLYYPDDTLQHAGVVTGLGGMAGHLFKFTARDAPAYHWQPFVARNCSAVTAACLVLRKSVFDELGGLDEKHLPVAFNDVDFCLRLRQRGYRVLWTPHAALYHLESASRGGDDTPPKYFRLQGELEVMRQRWGEALPRDPFYNPNLSLEYEDCALAYPPRGAQRK